MPIQSCAGCKNFQPNWEGFPKHLGWCDVKLPSWFVRQVPFNTDDFSRTVRCDDYCSLFEAEK